MSLDLAPQEAPGPPLPLAPLASLRWRRQSEMLRIGEGPWPAEMMTRETILRRFSDGRSAALLCAPGPVGAVLADARRFPRPEALRRQTRAGFGPIGLCADPQEEAARRAALAWLTAGARVRPLAALAARIAGAEAGAWAKAGRVSLAEAATRITLQTIWSGLFAAAEEGTAICPPIADAARRMPFCAGGDVSDAAATALELADLWLDEGLWRRAPTDHPLARAAAQNPGDPRIRADAALFLFSGHATSALTIAWCCRLLASSPALQEEILADPDPLAAARAAMSETLRLCPPAPQLLRRAAAPLETAEGEIPAGALLILSFHALHRRPALWDRPELFRPARFRAGAPAHDGWRPFGAGPNACPGAAVATASVAAAVLAILRVARLSAETAAPPGFRPALLSWPARPLVVRAAPR